MKVGNLILAGGAALLFYSFWNKSNIDYNIIGIKFNPARVVINFYNPTNAPLTFNSILADIVYNNNRIGILNSFVPVTIPANGQQSINIPVTGDVVGFIGLLSNLISQGVKNVNIGVLGTMKVNNITLPFQSNYKLL